MDYGGVLSVCVNTVNVRGYVFLYMCTSYDEVTLTYFRKYYFLIVISILGDICGSYLLNLLLKDRHWNVEFLIEKFWWSFKEWSQKTDISKVVHIWGTPLYLGMGLITFKTLLNQQISIESVLDMVQLEWSLEFADYVLLAVR